MGLDNLSAFVLKNVRKRSVKNTGPSPRKTCGVVAERGAAAAGLDSYHTNLPVSDELVEQPDRVTATPDASDKHVRKTTFFFKNLRTHFTPNNGLEIAHHRRIRMWTK